MTTNKKYIYFLLTIFVLMAFISCSGSKNEEKIEEANNEVHTSSTEEENNKSDAVDYEFVAKKDRLVLAVTNGDLAKVKEFASQNFYVHTTNSDGLLPLVEACIKGYYEISKYLIGEGANISSKDKRGWFPIIEASGSGNLKLVEYLLEKGADVNAIQRNNGMQPISFAAQTGSLEIVKYLLDYGVDGASTSTKRREIMVKAFYGGNIDLIKYLEKNGFELDSKDNQGRRFVLGAAYSGSMDLLKYLEKKGFELTVENYNGFASITNAADSGNLEMVKYLIEKGSDINTVSRNGETLLHFAAWAGSIDLVKFLMDNGLELDVKNTNAGISVPFYAVLSGNLALVEYLADNGLDLTVKTDWGSTLLHFATANGYLDIVRYLVEQSSLSVNAEDSEGDTVLSMAKGYPKIKEYLLEKGAIAPTAAKTYPTVSMDDKIWMRLAIEIADQHGVSISKIKSIKAEDLGDQGTGQGSRWDGKAGIDYDGVIVNAPFSVFVR